MSPLTECPRCGDKPVTADPKRGAVYRCGTRTYVDDGVFKADCRQSDTCKDRELAQLRPLRAEAQFLDAALRQATRQPAHVWDSEHCPELREWRERNRVE